MLANKPSRETSLVPSAVDWLEGRLPSGWAVERVRRDGAAGQEDVGAGQDGMLEVRAPDGASGAVVVEARRSLEPREVDLLLSGPGRSLRTLGGGAALLVVAPWLSARTQERLEAARVNFLDLTGNAMLRLDEPAVFIRTAGASRNPAPPERAPASIRGPKAARLLRLLIDVRPPYGVRELAQAAGLTAGYVSRLLDTMDRQALARRGRRGVVEDVDIPALLQAWAQQYDVFKTNAAAAFLAPQGAAAALERLGSAEVETLVTGSFAAVRLAPVAAPAMLVAYSRDVEATVDALGLLPADAGANVALLSAFDDVVWDRATSEAGIGYAAPSQVAVDCLTGNGRMPSEGEALVTWMTRNENDWRAASLDGSQGAPR